MLFNASVYKVAWDFIITYRANIFASNSGNFLLNPFICFRHYGFQSQFLLFSLVLQFEAFERVIRLLKLYKFDIIIIEEEWNF